MAIRYYPNRPYRRVPAIDRVLAKRKPINVNGVSEDLSGDPIDIIISPDYQRYGIYSDGWHLDSISLTFETVDPKDYSVRIVNGRKIITGLNDFFWFKVSGSLPKIITLDQGFYNGTELAAEIEDKLLNQPEWSAAGITHTCSYDNATGLFTITNTSGQLCSYVNSRPEVMLSDQNSIAGHVFGFELTSSQAPSIESDTVVAGLDSELFIINEAASIATYHYHDSLHVLSVDQAIRLTMDSASTISGNYNVVYEDIV